jgi:hypothetical protein
MKVSHRITRLVTAGLIAGALAAPAASARPAPLDSPVPAGSEPIVIEPAPAPVVQSVDEGFDWDSAAIGAGAAGALVLLIGVGGTTYRRRHDNIGVAR